MPVHHVKGQPAASTYVREKGGVKIVMDLWTPCIYIPQRERSLLYTCLDVSDVVLHEIADEQLVILFVLHVASDLLGCHLVEGR